MDSHAPLDPFVVTVVGHSPPVLPPLSENTRPIERR